MSQIRRSVRAFLAAVLAFALLAAAAPVADAQRRGGGGVGRAGRAVRPAPAARPSGAAKPYGGGASRAGQSNVNYAPKNVSAGNRNVKVDNSRSNVNVDRSRNVNNVNVQRNVMVRPAPRPYVRPPVVFGGFRYYAFRPYFYHPFRPFYFGAAFRPLGFFAVTLAATAIAVSVADAHYHYDHGVFYAPVSGGYTVVPAPIGAVVPTVPPGTETVVVNENTTNYYYGGTYYEKSSDGYTVVPPTAGTVVEHLPEGGKEVTIGEVTYVKVGETYYQPIQKDGKNAYEVVEVKAGAG